MEHVVFQFRHQDDEGQWLIGTEQSCCFADL